MQTLPKGILISGHPEPRKTLTLELNIIIYKEQHLRGGGADIPQAPTIHCMTSVNCDRPLIPSCEET
jgi:hypothetical protein